MPAKLDQLAVAAESAPFGLLEACWKLVGNMRAYHVRTNTTSPTRRITRPRRAWVVFFAAASQILPVELYHRHSNPCSAHPDHASPSPEAIWS